MANATGAAGWMELRTASCVFNVALSMPGFGTSQLQADINQRGLRSLDQHVVRFRQFKDAQHAQQAGAAVGLSDGSLAGHLADLLGDIRLSVESQQWSHEFLVNLDTLSKDMGGTTRLNCKSGKDRTQLLGSVLKAAAIQSKDKIARVQMVDYAIARELMWGSGLQIAYHNTGKARYKLTPCTIVRNLYNSSCWLWVRGSCVGMHQYMAAREIQK